MTRIFARLQSRLSACRGVLIDSNILLDVATNDAKWGGWSGRALAECAEYAALMINPVIYAEVSVGYRTIEALDTALPGALYRRAPLSWEAGFLAGKCFLLYRRFAALASSGFLHRRPCGRRKTRPSDSR